MFIDEECRSLKVAVNGRDNMVKTINQGKISDILQACRCPLFAKGCRLEHLFNKRLWNFVNHLGKHDFSYN